MKGFLLYRFNLYSIYYLILFLKWILVYRIVYNFMIIVLFIKYWLIYSFIGIKFLRVNFKDCFFILIIFFNIIKVIK